MSIYVTQPFLPPLEEFIPCLEEIWQNKRLTNNGPFHDKLEQKLCEYLEVPFISLFANGTLALVTALQALRITGEVITTPYSFVATTHALHWNGIQPVFVDIEPNTFNIDPAKIEAAITPRTTAIVPVHVYGNPCDVLAIERIADTYGLKVIYDAAHAFGVRYHESPVLNYGDLSILSFHATKVFNTFEGGAIICHDEKMKHRIDFLKNFGFADEITVIGFGINGKMSEFQAALGLLQLKYVDDSIEKRCQRFKYYLDSLADVKGIQSFCLNNGKSSNCAYFPVLIKDDYPLTRDELYEKFREAEIYVRRYFYPLISDMTLYKGLVSADPDNLPNAKFISDRVLCLPIYPELLFCEIDEVIKVIVCNGGVSG
jgi:dTDP-4-amino-4,6-dideoxygalactose transaminase